MATLDPEICYRAIVARDSRFDGRIFTGVTSTGIYCRPICPARTPLQRNCVFYPSAAAAQEAGFRPCLRCRPEVAPGLPACNGTSAVVMRALRLIDEGGLDESSVDGLALRLGIGGRHLRRLFLEQVGATPVAVAQNRRLLFAKRLLTETSLPVTDICFASGFTSVRRFNDVMAKSLGRSPREFRKSESTLLAPGTLELKLAYRPPFAWDHLLAFFAARAIPGVESVAAQEYRRTIRINSTTGWIAVRNDAARNCLIARMNLSSTRDLAAIVNRLRNMFDLACDPHEVHRHLTASDHMFRNTLPGVRLPGCWDRFELGVRAILGQQISVAAASTLAGRLASAFGEPTDHGILFPLPARLVDADIARVGLPLQRAESLRSLAIAAADGAFGTSAATLEETVEQLCRLRGVGPWTAHYLAMRAFQEPDAFPAGDLVLRKAAGNLSQAGLEKRAEAWRPWRAYAALNLWRLYANTNNGTRPTRAGSIGKPDR